MDNPGLNKDGYAEIAPAENPEQGTFDKPWRKNTWKERLIKGATYTGAVALGAVGAIAIAVNSSSSSSERRSSAGWDLQPSQPARPLTAELGNVPMWSPQPKFIPAPMGFYGPDSSGMPHTHMDGYYYWAVELNDEIQAIDLTVGDYLYDPAKSGTHGQRVIVQWTGLHRSRQRTYVAGLEETSRNPVQLAYDNHEKVKVYRRP